MQEIESLKTTQRVVEDELVSKISHIESFNSRIEEFEKEMASGKRTIERLEAEKAEETEKLVVFTGTQSQKQEELEKLQKEIQEKETTIARVRLDFFCT